ncbi:MAG: chemotaxis protein CheW [Myxococcota bacterium]
MATRPGWRHSLFALANRLHLQNQHETSAHVALILDTKPTPWALLVDDVSRVNEIARENVYPLPAVLVPGEGSFFSGILQLDSVFRLMLSPESMGVTAAPKVNAPRVESSAGGKKGLSAKQKRKRRVMCFDVGARWSGGDVSIGLRVTQVAEVFNRPILLEVPGSPSYVLGLTSWRSMPVPVVDLPQLLGLEKQGAEGLTRLVIVRGATESKLLGFPVKTSVTSMGLPIPDSRPVHGIDLLGGLISGGVELESGTLIIPNIEKITSPNG